MTVATTDPVGTGAAVTRWGLRIGLAVAIVALGLLAAGPIGWRSGLLSFRTGLLTLMPLAFYGGLAACAIAILAVAIGLRELGRRQFWLAVVVLAIGATAAYFPFQASQLRGKYPPMHDITTDFANPPQLKAALPLRAAEHAGPAAYPGAATEAMQQKYYPGIEPLVAKLPPAQEFERALATARQMGWTIVASDAAAGTVEAYDRSRWFGFTDDVVVRVSPAESGSRVDVRSVSRQGHGDFGVNARRVRAYLAALKAANPS